MKNNSYKFHLPLKDHCFHSLSFYCEWSNGIIFPTWGRGKQDPDWTLGLLDSQNPNNRISGNAIISNSASERELDMDTRMYILNEEIYVQRYQNELIQVRSSRTYISSFKYLCTYISSLSMYIRLSMLSSLPDALFERIALPLILLLGF